LKSGEADDERTAQHDAGNDGAGLGDQAQKDLRRSAALHPLQHTDGCVLQRHVEIFGDGIVPRDGLQQARRHLVGIGVEEAQPLQSGQHGHGVKQRGETVLQPEIFAVAGSVLADQGDLAHALRYKSLGLGDDGFHRPRAELAAQLGDDAEAAGVVASLGDLDVGRRSRRSQNARRLVAVEILGQSGGCAVPLFARESALPLAQIALSARLRNLLADLAGMGVLVDGAGCAADEDVEGRGCVRRRGGRGQSGGGEDVFQFAGADDGIDLGNVALNLVAIALDQTASDDQPLRLAAVGDLVLHHFKDRVDRFLLGRFDEAACVDDQNLRILGVWGQLAASAVEQAHHNLGIHQILRAAQRDEAHLGPRGFMRHGQGGILGHGRRVYGNRSGLAR